MRAASFRPVAFLDCQKAYDSVWLDALLFKLSKVGLPMVDLLWIKALVYGRSYRVRWNGLLSAPYFTTAGLGQGMVLSCLLFVIYIYDLSESVRRAAVLQSADDLCVVPESMRPRSIEDLQAAMSELCAYLMKWRLTLSPAKSGVLTFKNPNLRVPHFVIAAHGIPIPGVMQVK